MGRTRGATTLLAGLDENGLGPKLGPLVVTGVLARATAEGARWLRREGAGQTELIDDSKRLASFKKPAVAEAWARSLAPGAADAEALIERLALRPPGELRAPCPPHVAAQCWGAPVAFEASEALMASVAGEIADLRGRGVELLAVRSEIVCSERLHRAREAGQSLLDTDLHAMEDLLLALRAQAGADLDAVCGKVGGIDRYLPRLGPLAGLPAAVDEEGRAASRYRIAGLGTVAFVRDADGSDLLVALASLVGKYLREALMGKISAHYRAADAALPRPSGYRDPVTERFVALTEGRRRLDLVPDRCFVRP